MDLVVEHFDGRVVGIDVKAGTQIRAEDIRGLAALRDRLGTAFIGGVVLYTGEVAHQLTERVHAVPIDCLWR